MPQVKEKALPTITRGALPKDNLRDKRNSHKRKGHDALCSEREGSAQKIKCKGKL